jgi:GTP-binding protein
LSVSATFVRSAAGATDLPCDGLAEIALVGRSNVGKSSVINALVRRRVARTSAAPGKTRLANVYRIARGGDAPLYLVDLPGYGYARGAAAGAFEELAEAYFGRARPDAHAAAQGDVPRRPDLAALLLIDARHPGLQNDLEAWRWLRSTLDRVAIVATKVDKLARGERIRALRQLESVCEHPVTAVSAVTGEGLDELWKLIDRLLLNSSPGRPHRPRSRRAPAARAPAATTARVERCRPRNSSSRR